MKNSTINVLFISDIVGEPGLKITQNVINDIKDQYSIDCSIANGENASGGKGLNIKNVEFLFDIGINVITSGNHFWMKEKLLEKIDNYATVLRPANYPMENVGHGSTIYDVKGKGKIAVLNLQGRVFMQSIDCPFKIGAQEIKKLKKITNCILVDFHAEATAEKAAFAYRFDGKVSAVIGTHTHVQTADETILPEKTAFITDAGMTGPVDSVIGLKKEVAIRRFIYQTPVRYVLAEGEAQFNAVVVSINSESGEALDIKRISITKSEY
ncbi:TIGR00282 family metallophosphoesterase [candidate division KSB1 bacterium]|nr:TIGR00282 family metallophosphoesterase [candidate division KSB1 bacterium]